MSYSTRQRRQILDHILESLSIDDRMMGLYWEVRHDIRRKAAFSPHHLSYFLRITRITNQSQPRRNQCHR